MNPTITEGALIIGKRMPYEELQVGDIITFKKIDHIIQTVDENGQTHDEVVFLDNENITHRIVSIDVKGIHTKGDNEDADFYPVDESRYGSKVVWWNNYLGRPFRLMFTQKGLSLADRSSRGAWNRTGGIVDKGTKVANINKTRLTSVSHG